MEEREEGGKARRLVEVGAGCALGGWGGAGVLPSISPICSWAAMELSSARSPAVRAVDRRAHFCIVLAGEAC